ncbi:MAG: alpha/beta fold hydrolase [Nanoarchaeota archaeon]
MKRVFIVHGWEFSPNMNWYPWLKKELTPKGFSVHTPEMPDTTAPRIDAWVKTLAKAVGTPTKNTYFVGHSIGCQAILRYLAKTKKEIGGIVLVAPWLTLTPEAMPDETYRATAKPWLETPIDYAAVLQTTANITAIFSDDDPYVSPDNITFFKRHLNAAIIMDKGKGHFSAEEKVTRLPSALKAVLSLAKPL